MRGERKLEVGTRKGGESSSVCVDTTEMILSYTRRTVEMLRTDYNSVRALSMVRSLLVYERWRTLLKV